MEKEKKTTANEIESHSYNNPADIDSMINQGVETALDAKRKIDQQLASVDIVEEQGSRYAIVRDRDNKIIYKTKNPGMIDALFGQAH